MKTLIATLLLLSSSVFAEVYTCQAGEYQYLLALSESNNSGLVYSNQDGQFKEIKSDVMVERDLTSEKIIVSVQRHIGTLDFSNRCFAWLRPNLNFVLGEESTLQLFPVIKIDPQAQDCSAPRPMRGPPFSITCNLMK